MKKRILCTLLTLCMVMCVALPIMSYATMGVSASDSSAYGTLLTPDTTPPIGWAEDESNPYGTKKGQPFAITPWYEPIIYSYRNAEGQAAQDHTKVYSKWNFGINIAECTPSAMNAEENKPVEYKSTLPNVHRVPIGFLLSIMLHLLLEQLTTHSARAETIMLSLSVFAIWIIPRTLRRSATGYKTL